MANLGDNNLKTRTLNKIQFLEDQLNSLDHYLPETYDFLMQELDQQKLTLAELEVQEHFDQIDEHDIPNASTPS